MHSLFGGSARQLEAPNRLPHLVAALAVLATVLSFLIGTLPLSPFPAFLPVVMTASASLYLITALHLLRLYVLTGRSRLAGLGTTFALTGLLIFAYLSTFPGVIPFPAGWDFVAQGTTWLWIIWHLAFPFGIVISLLLPDEEHLHGPLTEALRFHNFLSIFFLLPLFIFLLSLLVIALAPHLPVLVTGTAYDNVGFGRFHLPFFALLLAALAFTFWRTHAATLLDRWLIVSLLITLCDAQITFGALDRYNLGWYLARLLTLGSAGLLFFALFDDFARIYGRLAFTHEALRVSARTDALTQLVNREYALERAETLLRTHTPFTLALMDLDHFKSINDTHGHLVGDDVLRLAAGRVAHTIKAQDLIGRIGGEEFVLLFPQLNATKAGLVGERVLAALRSSAIPTRSLPLNITASMGMAVFIEGEALNHLLARADTALYAAKSAGRDRLVVAESLVPTS